MTSERLALIAVSIGLAITCVAWVVAYSSDTRDHQLRLLRLHYRNALLESAEKTAGMRKLLEAKDCFVRATLDEVKASKALES